MNKEEIEKEAESPIIKLAKSCLFSGRRGYLSTQSDEECWNDFVTHNFNVEILNAAFSDSTFAQSQSNEQNKEPVCCGMIPHPNEIERAGKIEPYEPKSNNNHSEIVMTGAKSLIENAIEDYINSL